MMRTTPTCGRLRRLALATLGGVVALGVFEVSPVSAQTADPPPATVIDSFCANIPQDYDPFVDVSDSHTFAEAIRCQAYARITFGVRPGEYMPGATITRGQMASFLTRMIDTANELELSELNELPPYDGTNDFTDMSETDTHVESVNRLADVGVVLGGPGDLPATSYGPSLPVSREHMASFITRSLEHLTGVQRATDNDYFTDDDTSIHEPNINALAEVGIAVGNGVDLFDPRQSLTRGQMSAFIIRSLANLEVGDVITPLPERTLPSDAFSTSAAVDNENGSATISFTVRDGRNEGIDGLRADDFSLVIPGQTTPSNLATLIDSFPDTWGPFTDADAGNGVYTVILRAAPGTYTYTDIAALGVEIDPSLEVTITDG